MPDPATEEGEHIFDAVAAGPGSRRWPPASSSWGLIFWAACRFIAQRRRGPGPDPLQPAARDLLHDRPDPDGDRLLLLDREQQNDVIATRSASPDRRSSSASSGPGRSTTPTRGGQRPATSSHRRHRRATSRRWCCPVDEPSVQAPLTRRHPLLLESRLPDEDGRHPRPRQRLPGHARPDRRLPRQVRGALRGLPLADAVQREGRSEATYEAYLQDLRPQGTSRTPPLIGGVTTPTRRPGLETSRGRLRMTATARTSTAGTRRRSRPLGQQIVTVLTTTDHKVIGNLYLITSFAWFLIGGVMALLMRAELAFPGMQFVDDEHYNQLFTMHGTIMLLLFATPLFVGFANVIMPLQIGAPDVAFPRLNMLQLLAVPLRRPDRRLRVPDPGRAPPTSAGSPTAAVQRRQLARRRRRPVDHGAGAGRPRHHPGRGQLHHHDHLHARARHDHVPDADLHLEHAGHQPAGADRLPGAGRRAARAGGRPTARGARLRPRQRRRRSCGSTCSGSSATPRSTSSRCRSSASSRRSSRSSAASRSSATSAWSAPRSPSRSCRWRSGPTTCTSPARSTCRSSPA